MDSSKRIAKLRQHMEENQLEATVIINFENQYYMSGFKAITYSRPILLIIDQQQTSLVVPALEENHAREESSADQLFVYYEHPEKSSYGISHLEHLKKLVSSYPSGAKIGIEYHSLPVTVANLLKDSGFELADIGGKIAEMRYIKDQQEIDLIIESGRLVSLALSHSLEKVKPGITEMEIDQFGNKALFEETSTKHPNATLDFFAMSPSGLQRSVMPHVFSNTRKLEENDIVVHSRQVGLNGYRAECERTFFLGRPTDKQKEAFKAAYEAQLAALEAIKVGITAKEVDNAARNIFRKAGLEQYSIHRTGHGIGIGLHEEPSLRFDNNLVLQEGMIFTIEPGIYIPEVGGFRHSDTVILSKDGTKLITEYPRELSDLIF
ncbi:aminopeptidase P family protein [Bacillus sp. V3-13]|uniref:M24 family metallopeptidase n=1 Tax=Bacillus sp. V3-13 TaxID=2053728 RepID=UPI000C76D87E|nr:Xaa-Pro peptidase family protein [Bacillus sp. V3-13]PLR77378.1 aminopeptidase P family protein [Bacillus sp. V3-13]